MRLAPILTATLLAAPFVQAEQVEITIKTLRAQMRYDQSEITVPPGAKVKLTFQNVDDMPHNIAFCDQGTDVVAMCAKMMEKPEEALKRNWEPDDKRVWLHSHTLDPQKSETLEFTAPEKAGDYPYVCTFPGHAMQMQGKLRVAADGPKLTGLKFALYNGDFKELPDFRTLTVHRQGAIDDGLIRLKFDDYKNQYAIVFSGKLTAPKKGDYTFYLTSDDGSQLLIDGKSVVKYDGIHPAGAIKEGKVTLEAGEHDFRLRYFQAAGGADLFVAWEGPGFRKTALSEWKPAGWEKSGAKKEDKTVGMPLAVGNEPVIYRNFITGAGNRAIGVGFPGNMNIAWSAEVMNLAIAWRGAFIDSARHWRDRGGGHQPPLGYDTFRPAELSGPFGIGGQWSTVQDGNRPSDYTWRGYKLDAKRVPTFEYEWQGVKVTDRIEASGDAVAGGGKLVRTLKLSGNIPAGALFRVANAAKITPQDGGFLVEGGRFMAEINTDNRFIVTAEGARLDGQNLVLPARPEIVVTYSWLGDHAHHHPTSAK